MEGEFQQVTIGKFIFRVKAGYLYRDDGLWLAPLAAAGTLRIGLSDYRQQSSGDVAFVVLPAVGQTVHGGDDVVNVETVKVDLAVPAPFDVEVTAVNEALVDAPELINQDPYGAGWLVELRPAAWPVVGLLDADAYLAVMTAQAEEAAK